MMISRESLLVYDFERFDLGFKESRSYNTAARLDGSMRRKTEVMMTTLGHVSISSEKTLSSGTERKRVLSWFTQMFRE